MAQRPPRVAFLSYSSGAFDARTARMARSAVAAGCEVVVYARLQDGLAATEERDGYRVVRAPMDLWRALPGVARLASRLPRPRRGRPARRTGPDGGHDGVAPSRTGAAPRSAPSLPVRLVTPLGRLGEALRVVAIFPVRPMAWARALDTVVTEPADVWHGMWAGSLPAALRLQARLGGRTVYDSRDVYLESRLFATTYGPLRAVLRALERRWARRVDRVLTVNEPYADLLARGLRVRRPAVVMNTPDAWVPPPEPPDLLRAATGIDAGTRVVLYQGQLIEHRGIEQAMAAILEVDGAALVLLGFGPLTARLRAEASRPPAAGRVFVLPPVPPDELLAWTASADVSVMAIQPTSANHRFTTPQKLFESLAVGVPVVASDLPGMAAIVRDADAGVLVDPSSPAAIAAGIRQLLAVPAANREARRARIRAVARTRYAWEGQFAVLEAEWRALLGSGERPAERPG